MTSGKARRTFWPLLTLFCWLAAAVAGHAADPFARVALQTTGKLYVGQQILIDVDVLVPNYFLEPPQFPPFDLPGTVVTLQDGRALNLNETAEGTDYSGIRRTYAITPLAAGDYTLPPAEIVFGYAAVPGQTTKGRVTLPPFRFTIGAAPGAASGGSGVVSAKVTLTQDLDHDPATLRAGDTLVRTTNIRAEGLRAMMIPEPEFAAPAGVRIYRQDPVLSEEKDQNGEAIAGLRKNVASYLFSEPGTYVLPAVDISWFDPATATTQHETAPAVTVTVAAAPAIQTGLAPPPSGERSTPVSWVGIAVAAAAVLGAGLAIGGSALGLTWLETRWEDRRARRESSEAAFFRKVEIACRDGSEVELAQALDAWSRKARIVPLAEWLHGFADAGTVAAYDGLQRALHGSSGSGRRGGQSDGLMAGLDRARRAWLQHTRNEPTREQSALPALNPDLDDFERVEITAM
ncbi:BatD family protein [Sinorhizobium sp. BG8]|uniref:BatD family protein n=1 Tax=Sinorhizobium sp. BG8 TaxID=2613773 RepID=UPI00193E86F2|nr:BatD family protein [Sinorhizobium sp. BG8]QRM54180.1 protein BatD [Sinorhizobium sp. BG8]